MFNRNIIISQQLLEKLKDDTSISLQASELRVLLLVLIQHVIDNMTDLQLDNNNRYRNRLYEYYTADSRAIHNFFFWGCRFCFACARLSILLALDLTFLRRGRRNADQNIKSAAHARRVGCGLLARACARRCREPDRLGDRQLVLRDRLGAANPANDAREMTELLTSAGFEVVQTPNLTQSGSRRRSAISPRRWRKRRRHGRARVLRRSRPAGGRQNFFVPVDARIAREADVPVQGVRLTDVMNMLSTVPHKTRIVILDACRNNPFSETNKTTGRGLAIVDAPTGSLVSYSTAPGTEAQDGDGAKQPLHGGAGEDRPRAGARHRAGAQAGALLGARGDAQSADAVGKLLAHGRLFYPGGAARSAERTPPAAASTGPACDRPARSRATPRRAAPGRARR